MIVRYTSQEFEMANSHGLLTLGCEECHGEFTKKKMYVKHQLKVANPKKMRFCSQSCRAQYDRIHNPSPSTKKIVVSCKHCGIEVIKNSCQVARTKNSFCSPSCATTYYNENRTYGYNVSKLEVYIKNKLNSLYPTLDIDYNCRMIFGLELDIFIPTLNFAVEINGPGHYIPIYGQDKLDKTMVKDDFKLKVAYAIGLELLVIDTTEQASFKALTSGKFVDMIVNEIDRRL